MKEDIGKSYCTLPNICHSGKDTHYGDNKNISLWQKWGDWGKQSEYRGCLDLWKYSAQYNNDGYMSLFICLICLIP